MKVQQYKTIKQDFLESVKDKENCDTLIIEFDYGQNLNLPRLNNSAQFYKRLLWLYVFNIHCHNDGRSKFYCL